MIEEAYVSFEVAKLLKKKGFDEPCVTKYFDDDKYADYSSPTQQMACRWLREVHGIHLEVGYTKYEYYVVPILLRTGQTLPYKDIDNHYSSYEQACEAAMKYCLEHLI